MGPKLQWFRLYKAIIIPFLIIFAIVKPRPLIKPSLTSNGQMCPVGFHQASIQGMLGAVPCGKCKQGLGPSELQRWRQGSACLGVWCPLKVLVSFCPAVLH